ncbi:hypothetical protein [Vibrio parahaemolyticus]|uniref:hypothetical protein n=1 Tax=Vibrio parahaemolyticus TaxID=670 RepID=UPI001C59B96A|nr:hypothetical protein [Vibrio parahaemolyticus]
MAMRQAPISLSMVAKPFLVKAGDSVKGVSITNINGNGVRLKQGARIRVLEGGL